MKAQNTPSSLKNNPFLKYKFHWCKKALSDRNCNCLKRKTKQKNMKLFTSREHCHRMRSWCLELLGTEVLHTYTHGVKPYCFLAILRATWKLQLILTKNNVLCKEPEKQKTWDIKLTLVLLGPLGCNNFYGASELAFKTRLVFWQQRGFQPCVRPSWKGDWESWRGKREETGDNVFCEWSAHCTRKTEESPVTGISLTLSCPVFSFVWEATM